jgi:hypothetical protein
LARPPRKHADTNENYPHIVLSEIFINDPKKRERLLPQRKKQLSFTRNGRKNPHNTTRDEILPIIIREGPREDV